MRVNLFMARLPGGGIKIFGDWREMHQYYEGAGINYEEAVKSRSYRTITAQSKSQLIAQLNSCLAQLNDEEAES